MHQECGGERYGPHGRGTESMLGSSASRSATSSGFQGGRDFHEDQAKEVHLVKPYVHRGTPRK